MKKILILLCASALSMMSVFAQSDNRSMKTTDIRMVRSGEYVTVEFMLDAGSKVTKARENLVVTPFLRGGTAERELPSIVIGGKRSKVLDARHELANGQRTREQGTVYMLAGGSMSYTTTLPYEPWMHGGQLVFEGVSVGCCSSAGVQLGLIADNILYSGEPVVETKIVEVPMDSPRGSTGYRLARQYPFIAPVSQLAQTGIDYNMPLDLGRGTSAPRNDLEQRFIDAAREGSIAIYFRQGSRVIDRNYMENNGHLVELISAVRALAEAEDSRIAKVIIAGFASPEGSSELNRRLAWDRAVVIKEFLAANSDIDPRVITVYNGGVDWTGLREKVAGSDLYHKQRILDIIDYMPVWDSRDNVGRLSELMRLDGGDPYHYMLTNFFPRLRQAAYIKVYYED